MLKIQYQPNSLYPELSKIIIKTSEKTVKLYPIIFSTKSEDKADCMEIYEHILKESELPENIINAYFYTFSQEFQKKFTQEFNPFFLYDPFEFDCELSLKKCSKKPDQFKKIRIPKSQNGKYNTKDTKEIKESYGSSKNLYIHEAKLYTKTVWRIVFKATDGKHKSKILDIKTKIEDVVKERDKMLKEFGLWKKKVKFNSSPSESLQETV